MACEQASHRMIEKLDGTIDATGTSELHTHMACCADCRADWERLQALDDLFRQAPVARPPRGFTGRVMARIDRRRWVGRLILGGAALGVGGMVAAVLLVGPSLLTLPAVPAWLDVLFEGGMILMAYLGRALLAFADSLCATVDVLMLPLMTTAVLGFLFALAANLAWLRLVQRLQSAPAVVRES